MIWDWFCLFGCQSFDLIDFPFAAHSRVHFPADQVQQHDSEIIVETEAAGILGVHLGFLQINHQYEIRFTIRDDLGEDLSSDPLQNLNVKLCSVVPTEDGRSFARWAVQSSSEPSPVASHCSFVHDWKYSFLPLHGMYIFVTKHAYLLQYSIF